MADVINLRNFRKRRDRQDAETQATENRALHGRSKLERHRAESEVEKARRALDGLRRDTGEET